MATSGNELASEMASEIKRRRKTAGGPVQRSRADEAAQPSVAAQSHLAKYLLEDWAFGGISATQLQIIAHLAQKDGLRHPSIDKLSSFGTFGKHPGNVDRDLRKFMESYLPFEHPKPDCVDIPLKILKGKDEGTHMLPQYYLQPHKLMHFLHKEFPSDFKRKLLGDDGAIEEFWSTIPADDPRIVQLAADHPDYKQKCVPIVLHGDGVPCTNNHSLDTISFESLVAKRSSSYSAIGTSTIDYIFFCTGCFTQTMEAKPKDGMEKTKIGLWKPLVSSFRACYYGDWPLLDTQGHEFTDADSVDFKMRGKPLAGRYKFVPWVLKGDMDFAINHFEMPGHWNSGHPCPACPCVREDGSLNSWNNFGPLAVWKGFVFEDMLPYRQHCAFKGKVVHQIHEPLDNNGLGAQS